MALVSKQLRTVEPSRFAMVPRTDVPRSAFDVRHTHKTTFEAGRLVPLYVDEVLPGDSFKLRMTAFCRTATALVPIMDNLIFESFFFFVPNRLLWTNWERFMGEQNSPTDSTVFLIPQIPVTDTHVGNSLYIYDVMGITLNNNLGVLNVNALPFRAYNLIWNDWFRDQDLAAPAIVATDEGPDNPLDYETRFRFKRHDYFTSARPWPEKPINLTDSGGMGSPLEPGGRMTRPQAGAPVSGLGVDTTAGKFGAGSFPTTGGRNESVSNFWATSDNDFYMKATPGAANFPDVRVLINDIRTANAIQLLMERNARGGTRYTEIVRSHFGVVSPDARLQRPEYLGGGRTYISVNPVAQTSATGADGTTTVLGELAGVGTGIASDHGFSTSFVEHGYILGLVCVRADLTYQQGLNRLFSRRTQMDFYWPTLAHLGEQAVMSREIFSIGGAGDDDVFGYQERWSEYKYMPNRVSGKFRSTDPQPLDMWHLAQHFLARPVLNEEFLVEDPPVSRVLQIEAFSETEFLLDSQFDVRKVRAMPMYSIPGLGPRM